MPPHSTSLKKRFFYIAGGLVLFTLVLLLVFVNFFLEPVLRQKLQALVIQGSDSLYTYHLGKLDANFWGGDIRVENLQIRVDSLRYKVLEKKNALPDLTIQLDLERGDILGIGFLPLLLGRKMAIREIFSKKANIVLIRHIPENRKAMIRPPLWQAIRPAISAITVDRVNLDGVKFLYKPADTSQSIKLQFDRFDALVRDIRIDSLGAADTSRVGFAKSMVFTFHHMKFRTADSSYKMKAERISYSSDRKEIEIDSFKLQPTLDKEDFYRYYGVQASLYYVQFDKIRLTHTYLDKFLRSNIAEADSILVEHPRLDIYLDKGQEKLFNSRIGSYPHQVLLKSATRIRIGNILLNRALIHYTEKNADTGAEGTLTLRDVNLQLHHVTNDPDLISRDNRCTAAAEGLILGNSPLKASFVFYLGDPHGRFEARGSLLNVGASQLNALSVPLANTEIPSLELHRLDFTVAAEDFTAHADVDMSYNHLSIILRKVDAQTGNRVTRKFITKLLNRYVLRPDNPDAAGRVFRARQVPFSRLTTQSFFGVIWKAVFGGMENIMMRSG